MTELTVWALLGTSLLTGLVHTLIPDHWLPFVLIGRARGWTVGLTVFLSGLSAMVHVLLSIVLGAASLWVGARAAAAAGESLETVSGALLVLFGLGYAGWSWHNRGHFHPGGRWLHRGENEASCAGEEGDANPEHLHFHADVALIRGRPGWSDLGLALIVGANPCVLLLPLMLAAGRRDVASVAATALAYGVPTVLLMVGLSAGGVAFGHRIRLPGIARHMETASGLLIAALGVVFLAVE